MKLFIMALLVLNFVTLNAQGVYDYTEIKAGSSANKATELKFKLTQANEYLVRHNVKQSQSGENWFTFEFNNSFEIYVYVEGVKKESVMQLYKLNADGELQKVYFTKPRDFDYGDLSIDKKLTEGRYYLNFMGELQSGELIDLEISADINTDSESFQPSEYDLTASDLPETLYCYSWSDIKNKMSCRDVSDGVRWAKKLKVSDYKNITCDRDWEYADDAFCGQSNYTRCTGYVWHYDCVLGLE